MQSNQDSDSTQAWRYTPLSRTCTHCYRGHVHTYIGIVPFIHWYRDIYTLLSCFRRVIMHTLAVEHGSSYLRYILVSCISLSIELFYTFWHILQPTLMTYSRIWCTLQYTCLCVFSLNYSGRVHANTIHTECALIFQTGFLLIMICDTS
jgi:hypothetical protein